MLSLFKTSVSEGAMIRDVKRRVSLLILAMLGCTSLAPEPHFANRQGYREAEVTFESDGTRLAAALLVPHTPPPYPGLVFIHGSGTSDRTNTFAAQLARRLAQNGIAVLLPDKRGSGKSGGDWKSVGLEALADDAVAGVRFLRQLNGVQRDAVGLLGFSQGGHVAPLAATLGEPVAFVINVSGSLVPLLEQMFDEVEMLAEREGLTSADIEQVNQIHRLAVSYGRSGQGWNEYRSLLEAARAGHLKGTRTVEGFPDTPDHWMWQWAARAADYDPLPYWRRVKAPALVVYGEEDTQVRVSKSVAVHEKLGDRASVRVYENAGHGLSETGTHVLRADFVGDVAGWIAQETGMELRHAPIAVGGTWICPPCGLSCDTRTFEAGGVCPVCGMELIPAE